MSASRRRNTRVLCHPHPPSCCVSLIPWSSSTSPPDPFDVSAVVPADCMAIVVNSSHALFINPVLFEFEDYLDDGETQATKGPSGSADSWPTSHSSEDFRSRNTLPFSLATPSSRPAPLLHGPSPPKTHCCLVLHRSAHQVRLLQPVVPYIGPGRAAVGVAVNPPDESFRRL